MPDQLRIYAELYWEKMPPSQIYFVETPSEGQRRLLCQWVERFYEEGKRVQVVVDSTMAAQHLDQMLWTFSQESFVPHSIFAFNKSSDLIEPVVITVCTPFCLHYITLSRRCWKSCAWSSSLYIYNHTWYFCYSCISDVFLH